MGRVMRDLAMWQLGEPVTERRERYLPMPLGRHVLAWVLVALVAILSTPAVGQPVATDLLRTLNLSGYPPGTKSPDFGGRTAEGGTVSLAGLQGRVVLLTFWATWCQECRPEMQVFEQLHREFAVQGFTVLGINVREGRRAIQQYARELGLTFPLVLDASGAIQVSYGVIGLPTTFLIGRDGRAVALAIGPRDWSTAQVRALIEALLAEPAARKGAR